MCMSGGGGTYSTTPARPAGAGYTVAKVDTDTSKYTKVYDEGLNDITDSVEEESAGKYRKKQSMPTFDTYASGA